MYQNKVTLIGFLGSNPEARTNNPDFSVTTLSLATKSSYKKDGKYISHTEWHRCVVFGKPLGVRQDADQGRAYPGGRRTAQPGIPEQEDGHEAAHLGNSGRFDPEAGPRRKGRPGRSGSR